MQQFLFCFALFQRDGKALGTQQLLLPIHPCAVRQGHLGGWAGGAVGVHGRWEREEGQWESCGPLRVNYPEHSPSGFQDLGDPMPGCGGVGTRPPVPWRFPGTYNLAWGADRVQPGLGPLHTLKPVGTKTDGRM